MDRTVISRRRMRLTSCLTGAALVAAAFAAQRWAPQATPALVAAGVGFAAAGGGFPGLLVAVFGAGVAPLPTELRIAFGICAVAIFDRTSRAREETDAIAEEAFVDRLTGLYTYAFFQEALGREVQRVRRYGGECSLIVFDLDRFKDFNDRYGHAAGNDLLHRVGAEILRLKRESDIAARFGGEELCVLVPGGTLQATGLAERIRSNVSGLAVMHDRRPVGTTISAGVAAFGVDGESATELFAAADAALYEAKRLGRNIVVTASQVDQSVDAPRIAAG